VSPVGLYVFLPIVMIWTARHAWQLSRASDQESSARAAMLWLCLFNVTYVVGISSAVTFLESSRYRYQAESLMWVMAALCVATVCSTLARAAHRKTVIGTRFP
jgi:hypothetical protein